MKKSILLLLLIANLHTMAQKRIEGEYFFRKQEMVAGFNFTKEGKFQFFFSYGAVDRSATGRFTVEGDTLKLVSDKQPGKDFTVTTQSKNGDGYTLKFNDPNKYLLTNIRCSFFMGNERRDEYTNENGEVKADLRNCDRIYVQHLLFPDMVTLIKDEQNTNNRFELTLNPSLGQVSFQGIDFKILDNDTITCVPNYLMEMEDIEFVKQ